MLILDCEKLMKINPNTTMFQTFRSLGSIWFISDYLPLQTVRIQGVKLKLFIFILAAQMIILKYLIVLNA